MVSPMMRRWNELHLGEEALGGLSAGVVGTVIGFPLDVVKTRMQTGSSNGKSIFSIGKGIVRNEGVFSLYKGMVPPLISLSILNTITFTQYTFYRELYNANPGWDYRNALAGITCAPIGSLVSTIENVVKVSLCCWNRSWLVSINSFSLIIFSEKFRHRCSWTM